MKEKSFKCILSYFQVLLTLTLLSQGSMAKEFVGKIGDTSVYLLDRHEAGQVLIENDDFLSSLTDFDRWLRHPQEKTDKADFLMFLEKQGLPWKESEVVFFKQLVTVADGLFLKTKLVLGPEITIVKSRGQEEFLRAYTRRNSIILPVTLFQVESLLLTAGKYQAEQLAKTFYHELFHILTRNSQDFRKRMHAFVGAHELPYSTGELDKKFQDYRVVHNPDDLNSPSYFKVRTKKLKNIRLRGGDEQNLMVIPFNVIPDNLLQRMSKRDISDYVIDSPKLYQLNEQFEFYLDESGKVSSVSAEETNFFELVMANSTYAISPEEVMAENFAILLSSGYRPENIKQCSYPEILDKMLGDQYFFGIKSDLFSTYFTSRKGVSRTDFYEVIATLEDLFREESNMRSGGNLLIEANWRSSIENATAISCTVDDPSNANKIIVNGGVARMPKMTKDALAAIVCHEIGHCLGGAPVVAGRIKKWSSAEGQADYWSTAKCLPKYFSSLDRQSFDRWKNSVLINQHAQESCQKVFKDLNKAKICLRTAQAALTVAENLNSSQISKASSDKSPLETPSAEVVRQTRLDYPSLQCRLDTLFQGALCNKNWELPALAKDEFSGFCNLNEGYRVGIRPTCWYRPSRSR